MKKRSITLGYEKRDVRAAGRTSHDSSRSTTNPGASSRAASHNDMNGQDMDCPLRYAWIGPAPGGLAWLRERLDRGEINLQLVHEATTFDRSTMKHLANQGLERLIIACPDRISYPRNEIHWLQRHIPDIPLALATDHWWDGSRRTGLGSPGHTCIPWYRWWDGWLDWFAGLSMQSTGRIQLGDCSQSPVRHGLIVSNCRQLAEAWRQCAVAAGQAVDTVTAAGWLRLNQPSLVSDIDWLLWDDSSLNSCRGARCELPMLECLHQAWKAKPQLLGIAAVTAPRVDWSVGVARHLRLEMIAKPSDGWSLLRILKS